MQHGVAQDAILALIHSLHTPQDNPGTFSEQTTTTTNHTSSRSLGNHNTAGQDHNHHASGLGAKFVRVNDSLYDSGDEDDTNRDGSRGIMNFLRKSLGKSTNRPDAT